MHGRAFTTASSKTSRAERCVAIVRAKDPGTLLYDWYLSADEKECLVRETYASSEAMLAHMANVGAELQAMMAVSDVAPAGG